MNLSQVEYDWEAIDRIAEEHLKSKIPPQPAEPPQNVSDFPDFSDFDLMDDIPEPEPTSAQQSNSKDSPHPPALIESDLTRGPDGILKDYDELTASRFWLGEKAGMNAADREKISQLTYELSKNTSFFVNEKKRTQRSHAYVTELLARKQRLGPPTSQLIASVERFISNLEANRDLSQIWVHIDMDAFFAAVEIRDNPVLRGKPIAVGGMSMISTSSYEARKFGVRSAMPGFIGKKLCPELIFVEPHFEKYREASATIREIFFLYDPHFEPLSLDEASLNITDYLSRNLNKSWEDVVREIQALVIEKTQGLTCSCGVSCNRRLAKLAADVNKPNGYYFIPPHREAILNYLNPLPVRKLSGIGKVTEQLLNGIGIHKVEDIYFNRYLIAQLLRQNVYESYIRMALGIGGEKHSEEQERKSIGRQKTFRKESRTPILLDYLKELSEKVASDLQKENLRAKSLTLVLKCSSFELRTRATTLPKFISTSEEIFAAASELFIESSVAELRLLGIRLSHFEGEEDESSSTKSSTARITSFFPKATKEEFLKMIDTESKSPLKSEKPNKASKYERPPKPLSDFFTRLPKDPNDNKRE